MELDYDIDITRNRRSSLWNDEVPKPGKFTKYMVDHYCKVMLITFFFSFILGMCGLIFNTGELGGSFTDPSDIRIKRIYAYYEGIDDYLDDSNATPEDERSVYFGSVNIIFESKTNDIFSVDNLNSIDYAQQEVINTKGYDDYCQLYYPDNGTAFCYQPTTITTFVWDDPSYTDSCACDNYWDEISCQVLDVEFNYADYTAPNDKNEYLPILQELCNATSTESSSCGSYTYNYKIQLASKDFECNKGKATYARVSFSNGLPLAGYDYSDEDLTDQYVELDSWYQSKLIDKLFHIKSKVEKSNKDITVYFEGDYFDITSYFLAKDLSYVILAFIFAFFLLWYGTNSIFLTICGLYEVLISFPLGLFFWYIVLQEEYITYLMYLGIFIILGVGLDDIFVFNDCFVQSGAQIPAISNNLYNRFIWTYERSAKAMLITSLTTLIVFIAAFSSPIWDIRSFGAVNGIMVLMDYLLVITWFPACVICYEKNIKSWFSWRLMLAKCLGKVGIKTNIVPKRYNNKIKNNNQNNSNEFIKNNETINPMNINNDNFYSNKNSKDTNNSSNDNFDFDVSNLRPMERFFANQYYKMISKYHLYIIILFFFITIATTNTWILLLEPDTKAPNTFADDHFVTISSDITSEEFETSSQEEKLRAYIIYGFKKNPLDNSNAHPADSFYYGDVRYDPDFDLYNHQEDLINVCNDIYNKTVEEGHTPSTDGYYCALNDFQTWRISKGLSFPLTDESNFISDLQEWFDASQYESYSYKNLTSFDPNYEASTGLELDTTNDRVKWAWLGFNTTLSTDGDDKISVLDNFYDDYQALIDEANDNYNDNNDFYGYQTCTSYFWLVAMEIFLTSSIINMVIGIVLALIILTIATLNWKLVMISGICLYSIVSMVFSLMAMAGWKINVIEAICITIAAGLSVDYVVHIIHTYEESNGNRKEKTRSTLTKMGISVISGASSTFFAALALYFCALLWFSIFGKFLTMIIFSSLLISLTLLPALLVMIGPEKEEGKIPIDWFFKYFPYFKRFQKK